MRIPALVVSFLLAAGGVALAGGGEHSPAEKSGGELLYVLLFFVAICQGLIAVGAVATFAKARWILPVRKHVFSMYPMLWLLAGAFLVWGLVSADAYRWTQNQSRWLNQDYWLVRNFGLMCLTAFFGTLLAREAVKEGPHAVKLAVAYLFSYVATQSLVAFDWVMSFEYPWYSTLFGGFFFMEALLSGFATTAFFWYSLQSKMDPVRFEATKGQRRDMAAMHFGFSIFWAYLMFSQLIVIWYSNLPEDTEFFLRRMPPHGPQWLETAMYSVLGLMFVVPFCALLSRKLKETPIVPATVACVTLTGILLERIVYLAPHLRLNPALISVYFVGFLLSFVACVTYRNGLLPAGPDVDAAPAHQAAH